MDMSPAGVENASDHGRNDVRSTYRAGGAIALMLALPAAAQEGDPQAGLELASELCTGCHIVGPERVGSDMAPPFRALASDPEMTLTALHAWPGPDHPVMGDMALSRQQIDDINAYLDHLREEATVPADAEEDALQEETGARPPAVEQAPPEKLGEPIEPSEDEEIPAAP